MPSFRRSAMRVARPLGLERTLRRLNGALPSVRRNQRDDDQIRFLCALTLTRRSNCVDIGANLGKILRHFVETSPEGHHIAFEPLPEIAAQLASDFRGVEVRQCAVSDGHGTSTFYRDRRLHTRSTLDAPAGGDGQATPTRFEAFEVTTEALDAALPPDYEPALIKVDVEGAELRVFEGARGTLSRYRPILVFEHQAQEASVNTTAELHRLLCQENGYEVFDMDGHGPLTVRALEATVASGRRWNFFARVRDPTGH